MVAILARSQSVFNVVSVVEDVFARTSSRSSGGGAVHVVAGAVATSLDSREVGRFWKLELEPVIRILPFSEKHHQSSMSIA